MKKIKNNFKPYIELAELLGESKPGFFVFNIYSLNMYQKKKGQSWVKKFQLAIFWWPKCIFYFMVYFVVEIWKQSIETIYIISSVTFGTPFSCTIFGNSLTVSLLKMGVSQGSFYPLASFEMYVREQTQKYLENRKKIWQLGNFILKFWQLAKNTKYIYFVSTLWGVKIR